MTSNPGFENGLTDWSAKSGSTLTLGYVGSAGVKALLLRSSTGTAVGYQRTNFAPPQDVDPHVVVGTARFRKHTASDTGTTSLAVIERTVEYGDPASGSIELLGECSASDYPVRRDVNNRVYVGNPVQVAFGSCLPTTSWVTCQTESGVTRGSATSLYDASDLTIEVRSSMKTSAGAWYGVEVDNAEVGYYATVVSR